VTNHTPAAAGRADGPAGRVDRPDGEIRRELTENLIPDQIRADPGHFTVTVEIIRRG
jgi:hypothetical protein